MCQMTFHTRNHTRIMHAIICPQSYLQYPHDSIERQQHKIITIITLPLFEIHHLTHNGKCIVTQLLMMSDNEPGCTTIPCRHPPHPQHNSCNQLPCHSTLFKLLVVLYQSMKTAVMNVVIVDGCFMCFWKVSKEGT